MGRFHEIWLFLFSVVYKNRTCVFLCSALPMPTENIARHALEAVRAELTKQLS
ncbi:hypothetical protein [Bartonella doshiae]|uniref:hypothetical protein n=1 Tax=Bartonella doshiae TaxID=33044 RepID=UPI0002EFC616|nr:hypothetical protein [Bartonella doshiae]MBB6159529.1 hypothetical protein [Bartonella doshiae]